MRILFKPFWLTLAFFSLIWIITVVYWRYKFEQRVPNPTRSLQALSDTSPLPAPPTLTPTPKPMNTLELEDIHTTLSYPQTSTVKFSTSDPRTGKPSSWKMFEFSQQDYSFKYTQYSPQAAELAPTWKEPGTKSEVFSRDNVVFTKYWKFLPTTSTRFYTYSSMISFTRNTIFHQLGYTFTAPTVFEAEKQLDTLLSQITFQDTTYFKINEPRYQDSRLNLQISVPYSFFVWSDPAQSFDYRFGISKSDQDNYYQRSPSLYIGSCQFNSTACLYGTSPTGKTANFTVMGKTHTADILKLTGFGGEPLTYLFQFSPETIRVPDGSWIGGPFHITGTFKDYSELPLLQNVISSLRPATR